MTVHYAPVGVYTYQRITHLRRTIEALQRNTIAKYTELYVFSDHPKKGDKQKVLIVREYLETITGFKKVHIVHRQSNGRDDNVNEGYKTLFSVSDKCIAMEDDVVTAPGFLEFMNGALDFYKDDTSIFSIGGYSPINHSGMYDVYLSPRFQSWGCGFWKEKYYLVNGIPSFDVIKSDTACVFSLRGMGDDMLHNIMMESSGKINGFDVRASYLCAKNNMFNVLPSQTLVKNIGMDGSGIHSGIDSRYNKTVLSKKNNFYFQSIQDVDWKWNRHCVSDNSVMYKKRPLMLRVLNVLNWFKRKFRDS